MPLHLLGKKSWNVYNADNIARVRRDEAEAKARAAEEERTQRHDEGGKRLAQLRGLPEPGGQNCTSEEVVAEESVGHCRKKRKLAGEDDTDRDLRLAQLPTTELRARNDRSLTDSQGHIDLIQHPSADAASRRPQKEEAQPEVKGMLLGNAVGGLEKSNKPWYSSSLGDGSYRPDAVGKDVWGNEDLGRRDRERKRMDASDPLAAIKKGAKQIREAEVRREEWRQQRERDMVEIEELARKERKRRRREPGEDNLDGFDLDQGYRNVHDGGERHRSHRTHSHRHPHSHHPRHRHRSRSQTPSRKERRHAHDSAPSRTR